MKVSVFREPCYFAETVYLLYNFVNHLSYEDEYRHICQNYCRTVPQEQDRTARQIRELTRVSTQVTQDMNPDDPQLRYFFSKLPGTDRKTCCCLAQIMLMSVPLDCSDVDEFSAQLLLEYASMQSQGIKINDMNAMGLVMERQDDQQEPEPLVRQLERLPCSLEARWDILRVLTDYTQCLGQLTELIRPVAQRLSRSMDTLNAMNEENLLQWSQYFETHTVDDFQNEMFNTTFLFHEENLPHEIWLGVWSFNPFGTWSEWMEGRDTRARVAYLGIGISFDFSAGRKNRPDAETLSAMLRGLAGKDKLETLRRCAVHPYPPARLASEMNLNSGTVSRNLYGLFKLGFLETRGDGERVNYVTRPESLEQMFRWVMEYIQGAE